MAWRDWNGDGKNDWQDNFFEYHYIYKPRMEKRKSQGYNSGDSGDSLVTVGMVLLIFGILMIIGMLFA